MAGRWTDERKAKSSAFHRARWGAPEGCATVHGIHVPFEHRDALRFWADWIAYHGGEEMARQFIEDVRDGDYAKMPTIKSLHEQRLQARETSREILALRREAWRVENQNGG